MTAEDRPLCRLFRIKRQTPRVASKAPTTVQAIPIPAAAPLLTPELFGVGIGGTGTPEPVELDTVDVADVDTEEEGDGLVMVGGIEGAVGGAVGEVVADNTEVLDWEVDGELFAWVEI